MVNFKSASASAVALIAVQAGIVATAAAADYAIIHAGKLLATPGSPPKEAQTIIVKDGRVERVAAGYLDAAAAGAAAEDRARIYDLKSFFVLPGLIDSHVHITGENNPQQRLQTVEMSDADDAIAAAGFAKKTLMAGFTTVRDVGAGSGDAIFALRDGILRGDVVGPRIFASGATVSITGGHGDGTQGYRDDDRGSAAFVRRLRRPRRLPSRGARTGASRRRPHQADGDRRGSLQHRGGS